MPAVDTFKWSQLGNIPEKPGIYAWYYSPKISKCDIDRFIETVNKLNGEGAVAEAQRIVRAFLEKQLFRFFKEDPFFAQITGALKPSYEGELRHQTTISEGLIKRLSERPDRIQSIRSVLELTTPNFASPIYIGMSDGLRSRIAGHKALIERFRKHFSASESTDGVEEDGDAGFARRVAQRGIPPELLFVTTCVVEGENGIHVDLENILNRIYYPILGRN
jgi:hypothetical protein